MSAYLVWCGAYGVRWTRVKRYGRCYHHGFYSDIKLENKKRIFDIDIELISRK